MLLVLVFPTLLYVLPTTLLVLLTVTNRQVKFHDWDLSDSQGTCDDICCYWDTWHQHIDRPVRSKGPFLKPRLLFGVNLRCDIS